MSVSIESCNLMIAELALANLQDRALRLGRDRVEVIAQYDAAHAVGDERTAAELAKLRTELEAHPAECPALITRAERRQEAAVFAARTHREETR